MKKKRLKKSCLLLLAGAMTATVVSGVGSAVYAGEVLMDGQNDEDETKTYDNLTITGDSGSYTYNNGNLTITKSGTFTLSGKCKTLTVNNGLDVTMTANKLEIHNETSSSYSTNTIEIGNGSTLRINLLGSNKFICQTDVGDGYSHTVQGNSNSKLIIDVEDGTSELEVHRYGSQSVYSCDSIDIEVNGGTVNGISGVTPTYGTNSWVEPLNINNWKYGETPSTPTARAKIGKTEFSYSTVEDTGYTDNVPTEVGNYYVKARVYLDGRAIETVKQFSIEQGDTELSITTESMDKAYDKQAVAEPTVNKTGSSKDVVFTWYQKNGESWDEISEAPTNVGKYKVVASVEADDNYKEASVEKEFTISKGNSVISITNDLNKTYDGKAVAEPSIDKTGSTKDVVIKWYQKISRIWEELITAPINAGEYKVVVSVEADDNYEAASVKKEFEISKLDSTVSITSDLNKTYDGNAVTKPTVEKTGSSKDVVITWFKKIDAN